MNTKQIVIGILASLSLSFGLGYAGYVYGKKVAAAEVVDFLSYICSKGAVVQDSSGGYFMCTPAVISKEEKKTLDNDA